MNQSNDSSTLKMADQYFIDQSILHPSSAVIEQMPGLLLTWLSWK